jgi:hypothetical protein
LRFTATNLIEDCLVAHLVSGQVVDQQDDLIVDAFIFERYFD